MKKKNRSDEKSYTFLLLRGLTREKRHWFDFADRLKEADYCHEVVSCDFPGVGDFSGTFSPISIGEIADHVLTEVKDLICKKTPLALIAISLGGMVGYEIARRQPDLFEKMIFINTSFSGLSPFYQRLKWTAIPSVLRYTLAKDPKDKERQIFRLVTGGLAQEEDYLEALVTISDSAPVSTAAAIGQLLAAARYRFDLCSALKGRGRVLASTQDKLVSVQCSASLAEAMNWKAVYHPSAGHDLPLDDPDWVLEEIAKYCR